MKYAGNVIYNSEANWESDDYAPSGLCTGSQRFNWGNGNFWRERAILIDCEAARKAGALGETREEAKELLEAMENIERENGDAD
jgi:hypothetical protein